MLVWRNNCGWLVVFCHGAGFETTEDKSSVQIKKKKFKPGGSTACISRISFGQTASFVELTSCNLSSGVLQKHKWEDAMTVDKHSWGFRRNTVLADYLTMDNLTSILASAVR